MVNNVNADTQQIYSIESEIAKISVSERNKLGGSALQTH
jgi:hypothetical protein